MMLGEGGENGNDTNINFLTEEYGIMVNSGEDKTIVDNQTIKMIRNKTLTLIIPFRLSHSYGFLQVFSSQGSSNS